MKNILFFLLPKSNTAFLYDDDSLRQAVEKMEYHRYSLVPVISRDGKYVRSISEGDILYAMKRENLTFDTIHRCPLEIASSNRDIKPVKVDATLNDLKELIITQNYVPVVDDKGIFIGIVTRKSIMNVLFDEGVKE